MADTVPGSVASTVTVTVGSTTNGTLDFVGDHDFYKINLTAGQSITVNLHGVTITDTYLRIYDAAGNLLYENDDESGGSLDSEVSFTAGTSGAYYIDVGAWDDAEQGTFQFTVTTYSPPPEGTFQDIATQLISGYWGASGGHHYNVTQGGTIRVDISGLTAAGQNLARAALQQWSDIIGVTFQEVTNGTEQILFKDDLDPEGPVAFTSSEWQYGITSHSIVHISTDWLTQSGSSLTSYGYTTYVHEIGHALGLGHAGDYNGDARYPFDAEFQYDSWATSVMSYFSQQDNTYWADKGFNFNYPTSPMIADILAMQQMYGLSTTTRLGDTVYGSTWSTSMGAITVFDSGGNDTINVSSLGGNQLINLNPGTFSNVGGEIGNVGIAFSVTIENATTSSGADTLIGNSVANVLQSGGGADTLNGGAGNDTLTGGAGIDTLTGGTGNDIFSDTKAGLNGDTIADFTAGDIIILTDATLSGFTFSLSGTTLTYSGGSVKLTGIVGTFTATAAASGGVQLSLTASGVIPYDAANDFNGDGRSDALWRNDAGTITNWLGTTSGGLTPNNGNFVAGVGTDWKVAGVGDFNGDLKDDILWRNANGTLSDWLGQANGGFSANNGNFVAGIGADWSVAGIGDFNGDQKDDILWRNTNGTLTDWLGTATGAFTANNGNFVAGIGSDWTVEGVGDFNGDGKDDILWRNSNGTVTDWLGTANGGFTPNNGNFVAGIGAEWSVAGVGDFNGDGKDDILWRNSNGTLTDWLGTANGGFTPNNGNFVAGIGAEWTAIQIGDFNGDHRDDILWRNSSGTISNWLGTQTGGFTPNSGNFVAGLGLEWHQQPVDLL